MKCCEYAPRPYTEIFVKIKKLRRDKRSSLFWNRDGDEWEGFNETGTMSEGLSETDGQPRRNGRSEIKVMKSFILVSKTPKKLHFNLRGKIGFLPNGLRHVGIKVIGTDLCAMS